MGFLKNIFGKKEHPIQTYDDFWKWFVQNERTFFNAVKTHTNIERDFFDHLSPKLNQLREGYFYVTGMFDKNTAELIITADGAIKNIVFVEELVAAAPALNNWRFTALKPALSIKDVSIDMDGYKFNAENLNFYANDLEEYPDEIDITIVHDDFNEKDKKTIINGCYIFLDNFLGELELVTAIDNVTFASESEAQKELVPIGKLKDFLNWRQKEFIEKYAGTWHDIENDEYVGMEAQLKNSNMIIATLNQSLLQWDAKASHPWMLQVEIKYDGKSTNGMPDQEAQNLLKEIEDKLDNFLKSSEGYLNVGRQTGNGEREIYFACKEFRKPSKLLADIANEYADKIKIDFDIYKDKYWRALDRFN